MLNNGEIATEWQSWKESEGQLLRYRYFLGNEVTVSTTDKPFVLKQGTTLLVKSVIEGEYVSVLADGFNYQITQLIILEKPDLVLPYQSGDKELEYVRKNPRIDNFLRSWFSENLKKDSE